MIILNLILDILIANLTGFSTYFLLVNIYKIPSRYFLIIILIALFIDIVIFHSPFNIIILPLIYFLFHRRKEKNLLLNILNNTLIYVIYIISLYLIFNYQNSNLFYLIKYLLINYPFYFIYLLISSRLAFKS